MSSALGPFLVTGGSGNVGREVLRALCARGATVRLAYHQAEPAAATGAVEPVRLEFRDRSTWNAALRGCRGLFLMRPNPVLAAGKILNPFLDAAASAGIQHCVFLSVAGAERNPRVPHHAVEQHLKRGVLRWTMLRAAFFAQNLAGPYREDIRRGQLVLPAGDARIAWVDTCDLGEVAAIALCDPERYGGQAWHLTGPDSMGFAAVAQLLTEALQRPVTYRPASLWGFWRHARRHGVARVPALAYLIIHAALRGGSGAPLDPTLERLLGRPGRSLRDYIAENRDIWN